MRDIAAVAVDRLKKRTYEASVHLADLLYPPVPIL
jgi:hypothetical protein